MSNSTELTDASRDVVMGDADRHELPDQSLLQKENEDLWTASNQTENIVMELSLDGIVRFVSNDWEDVVGTSVKKLINKPISDFILGIDEDRKLFEKATQVMEKEDMSYRCRFKVKTGSLLDRHTYLPGSDEEHTRGADEDYAVTFSTSVPNERRTFLDREVLSGDTDDDEDMDNSSKAVVGSTHRSDTRSIGSSFSLRLEDDDDEDALDLTVADGDDLDDNILELEGQGMLMRYKSGQASHTMWLLKPYLQSDLTDVFDIPPGLANELGFGADVLVKFLKDLTDAMITEMDSVPAPPSELCRICERCIPTWWFERHSNICSLEHKCESELTLAHENLLEQRNTIASLIKRVDNHVYGPSAGMSEAPVSPASSLNSGSSHTFASSSASSPSAPRTPTIEYSGFPLALPPPDSIGSPPRSPIRHTGTQVSSPLVKRALQQQRTGSGSNSGRKNPIRFMELLLELCDMALQIRVPDARHSEEPSMVHSPQSETRIHQVQGWAPSHVDDPGLAALCADTETFAKQKVEAAIRLGNTILYSERIRKEVDAQVHQVIEKTVETIIEQQEQYYDEVIGDEEEAMDEDDPYDADFDDDHVASMDEPSKKPALLRASTTPVADSPKVEDDHKGHRHSTSTSIFSDLYLRGDDLPSPAIPTSKAQHTERSLSTVSTSPSTSLGLHTLRKLNTNLHNTSPHDGSSSSSLSEIRGPRTLTPKALLSGVTRLRSQSNAMESDSGGGTDDHMAEYDMNASLPRIRPRNSISALGTQLSSAPFSPKPGSSPLSTARSMGNIHSPLTPFSSPLLIPHEQIHERYHRRRSSAASDFTRTPVSPLLTSTVPSTKPPQPSIRDYEIVNVISKGAFGSVYLARKKLTGEYFAIKVLKKQDMVVKNQVMNVKSERAILMAQADSPFVTKLFYTFQSKDYLFLVMEYLNGGDCAVLIKALGGLSESWAQQYMAEVVVGLEDLHKKGIVHRDLKPDNLLIDQHGHLKLTDFGLSRMGVIGRQKKVHTGSNTGGSSSSADTPVSEFPPIVSIRTPSDVLNRASSSVSTGVLHDPSISLVPGYFNLHRVGSMDRQHGSGSFGSGSGSGIAVISEDSSDSSTNASRVPLYDPEDKSRKFVGTTDYLAPETINGEGQDERSDWWSIGCILFEFLFGYPPFHDETPERVFANILVRRIQWPPETEQISREAVDLIDKLLTMDPAQRLGSNGANEIKAHPFFMGIHNWDSLWKGKASFVPDVTNPESTDYFDSRGAVMQEFAEELADELDEVKQSAYQSDSSETAAGSPGLRKGRKQTMPLHIPPHVRDSSRARRMTEPVQNDDFGSFSFKNLPVLERANKELITKLRHDSMERRNSMNEVPRGMSVSTSALLRGISPSSSLNSGQSSPRNPSMVAVSPVLAATRSRLASNSTSHSMSEDDTDIPPPRNLPPKAIPIIRRRKSFGQKSIGTIGSPESFLQPPPAILQRKGYNMRRLSNMGSSPELREEFRRGFQQTRPARRSGSGVQVFDMSPYNSDSEEFKNNALQRVHKRRQASEQHSGEPVYRSLDILLCIMNPVWRYSTEKMLVGLGNRVVSVADGAETIRRATGDVKFDIIFTEYKLPKTSGADVARLIHNTSSHNTATPIVAITNFVGDALSESTKDRATVFESVLQKPPTTEKLVSHLERVCNWKRIESKNEHEAMPEGETNLAVPQEAAA